MLLITFSMHRHGVVHEVHCTKWSYITTCAQIAAERKNDEFAHFCAPGPYLGLGPNPDPPGGWLNEHTSMKYRSRTTPRVAPGSSPGAGAGHTSKSTGNTQYAANFSDPPRGARRTTITQQIMDHLTPKAKKDL